MSDTAAETKPETTGQHRLLMRTFRKTRRYSSSAALFCFHECASLSRERSVPSRYLTCKFDLVELIRNDPCEKSVNSRRTA